MKSFTYVHILIAAVVAVLAGAIIGYTIGFDIGWERAISPASPDRPAQTITNFDECAAAGNPVMESYPRQCRANGKTYVEEIDRPIPVEPDGSIGDGKTGCVPAGCSGQVCAELSEAGGIVTTCEYREEYACYKLTKCERQSNGRCGWTPTAGFDACLANPPSLQ